MSAILQLKSKVRDLPNKPGVYLMRDQLGRVIYVGKARSLLKRVGQYFHPSRQMRWDPKTRALIESIADVDTFVVNSEPEALPRGTRTCNLLVTATSILPSPSAWPCWCSARCAGCCGSRNLMNCWQR
jgi:hypothetical protein